METLSVKNNVGIPAIVSVCAVDQSLLSIY